MSTAVKVTSRPLRSDNPNFNDDFTPREYQTSLYEKAKRCNTVICTSTGKEFIAMMVISEKSGPLRLSYEEGGKRTIITIPNKQMACKHLETVKNHTDLIARVYSSEDSVNECTRQFWRREINNHQVLIMPCEIFQKLILFDILPMNRVNLIVFDECHHAASETGNQLYKEIMSHIKLLPEVQRPHILGLTPSLISRRCQPNEIKDKIRKLQDIFLSHVETNCDIKTLNKYGATPEVEVAYFNPVVHLTKEDISSIDSHQAEMMQLLQTMSHIEFSRLKNSDIQKTLYSISSVIKTALTMGIWSAYKLCRIYSDDIGNFIQFNQSTNRSYCALMSALKNHFDCGVIAYGTRLRCLSDEYDRLIKLASPKMLLLLDKLSEYSPSNELSKNRKPLCGIVFVEEKKDVYLLSLWLQALSRVRGETFGFLKVDYVIGSGNSSDCSKLDQLHQEITLTKFRKHELNLLISTSVLEEGLDVPRCNLVIGYHFPSSIRQYIQSKGRARSEGSRFIVFVCDTVNSVEHGRQVSSLSDYQQLELMLSQKDTNPSHKESNEVDEEAEMRMIEKLKALNVYTTSSGVQLSLNCAISIINRYCMKLPSDSFTKLVAISTILEEESSGSWLTPDEQKNHKKWYSCQLRLPINCPLRTIITGDVCPSAKLAKKSAAFKACVELHKMKELDDNLLPVGKENLKYLCEDLQFEPYGQEFDLIGKDCKDLPRPGTTKRRQYYTKLTADVLKGCPPTPDTACYMYIFAMRLSSQIPDEQNTRKRRISDPAETRRSFGIIIPHKVPEICDFPVFTRSGEVTVSLQESSDKVTLSASEISRISCFHDYVFHSVLKVDPFPIKFDIERANTNYYLVPVMWNRKWHPESSSWIDCSNETTQIDWCIMDKVEEYKLKGDHTPSEGERGDFIFNKQHFQDAVVKRWYFKSREEYFYVAEICDDESPLSPFPDDHYTNYVHYYQEKYNIKLQNMTQPLLDVDHTSARLNLLTPRYVNRKGVSLSTTKKEKKENVPQKLHLIPELCCIHPFPASFWRKTVTLPCILYRMNVLLNAEQLRAQIASDISIGPVTLAPGQRWPPLDFGWPLIPDPNGQNQVTSSSPEPPAAPVTRKKKNFQSKCKLTANSVNHDNTLTQDIPSINNLNVTDDDTFIIDTFDPSKHIVHEQDFNEDVLFDSVDSMLLGKKPAGVFSLPTFINSSATWDRESSKSSKQPKIIELNDNEEQFDDYEIRGGSPSLMENDAWDDEDDGFITVGLPVGLERISVTHEFNAEALRRDLARQRDFEYDYDSDDSIDDDIDDADDSADLSHSNSQETSSPLQQIKSVAQNTCPVIKLFDYFPFNFDGDDSENNSINALLPDADWPVPPGIKNNFDKLAHQLAKLKEQVKPNVPNTQVKLTDEQETHQTVSCDEGAKEREEKNGPVNNETRFGELLPKAKRIQQDVTVECKLKFDAYKCDMQCVIGPSPNEILQALTMSNASDGINLERLETVGDSFLKYAVTLFLYCKCPNIHEGKLSYLRSRQISNFNLYRQGQRKGLGQYIIATKFEPNDNWLPPGYYIPKGLDEALVELGADAAVDLTKLQTLDIHSKPQDELKAEILKIKDQLVIPSNSNPLTFKDVDKEKNAQQRSHYSLISQQSIPDKSIADCVEALIGAYLLHAGPRGALYLMRWLNLKVMHDHIEDSWNCDPNDPLWHHMPPVASPVNWYLLNESMSNIRNSQLTKLYFDAGLANFENNVLDYTFKDKAYLIQAFTHNSYFENQLTDCYQRLEFLGDAILDYLVTRMLYEDSRKHSPGILTDLRSALVNNTFFASLAVEYQFHKYLKNTSHDLYKVINDFVNSSLAKEVSASGSTGLRGLYRANASTIAHCESETLLGDVEVPKALGDIFESVAGAIFLDSGMSLDEVWRVYYPMMKPEIEHFSENVPKSPIRELLELEPQNAQFGKPELVPGKRVRVTVEIFGEQKFSGIGRNKRIAKCTAAKQALKYIKGQKEGKTNS